MNNGMGELEQNVVGKYLRELEIVKKQKAGVDSKVKKALNEQKELQNRIDNINKFLASTKQSIEMSQHAWLRYFERVLGYNLREIEREIISKEICDRHYKLGDGIYQKGNFNLVIQNKKVVTITGGGK